MTNEKKRSREVRIQNVPDKTLDGLSEISRRAGVPSASIIKTKLIEWIDEYRAKKTT